MLQSVKKRPSIEGWEKLQRRKSEVESSSKIRACTLQALSERTTLDPHTLRKIFNKQTGVDQRSLSRCFRAFNLTLEPGDYAQIESKMMLLCRS